MKQREIVVNFAFFNFTHKSFIGNLIVFRD